MATHLVDKSAYSRFHVGSVRSRLEPMLASGRIAVTGIGLIEILDSSRNATDFDLRRGVLEGMPRVAINEQIVDRALEVMRLMAIRGTHRAPSPADLILAACAEVNHLTVLHYDKDFDLIADASGQRTEWVVPAGSV